MATYTVVRNDCLWNIAKKKLGNATRWPEIASLNSISSPYTIYVGQTLQLPGGTPGTPTPSTPAMQRPVVQFFGLLSQESGQSDNFQVFAKWKWDRLSNTKSFRVIWYYYASGFWFIGNDSTLEYDSSVAEASTQSVYTIPSNASKIRFKVKPISKTYKGANDAEINYWTADWSVNRDYDTSNNPPPIPSVPSIEIEDYKLTAELNLASNFDAQSIQFQTVKNNTTTYNTSPLVKLTTGHVEYSCSVAASGEYKVRCRSYKNGKYSGWSEYSGNETTIPSVPSGISVCKATSKTSIYLEWSAVTSAESYDVEYTTKKEYFDGSDQTTTISNIEFTHYEKTGLETGNEYFFRVRSVNDKGSSGWSKISSVIIGTKPAAPTTWSSTTTGMVGDNVTFYWLHNSEDSSLQTYAELEILVNGTPISPNVVLGRVAEDSDVNTYYTFDTSSYTEGTKIYWRVRTAGVTGYVGGVLQTAELSDWSVQRIVDIYAPATLGLTATYQNGMSIGDTLTTFPFYIHGDPGPSSQNPISFYISVITNQSYETIDSVGNKKIISSGAEVYSKNINASGNTDGEGNILLALSASNIDLEDNVSYTVKCTVSMDSGLIAEASYSFTVEWAEASYVPNAEIGIDKNTLSAYIKPYCVEYDDELASDELVTGITLSVYRREFDGGFTELATGLTNNGTTFVNDPHPALDYARYRIVAIENETGAVGYYDLPAYEVGEKSAIIQWDEEWSDFDYDSISATEEHVWSGSMIKLPYNVDVSNSYAIDSSLINYAGRNHPVSYYGTQLGEKETWNIEIVKSDKETLYALRRLSIWRGDCYIREPSGSGYWANVSVSFSQKHCDLTIPVTIDVTRVEGDA